MSGAFEHLNKKLDRPLTVKSRLLVLLAVAAMVPTLFLPMWQMTFFAQQYPEGLELFIYSHDLVGGDDGNDLTEINVLNHYIGMAELKPSDFTELKWIPLLIGMIALLALRAATIGNLRSLVDVVLILIYFGGFSLWSFWYKLQYYGGNLDPRASVNVEPFMPPMFGYRLVGQFDVWSYPSWGTYCFTLVGILLLGGIWFTWRQGQE
jgi:hypothetical protein